MEIRQLTGLSQEYTAAMLDVSRTVIAMHEAGNRPLPTPAIIYATHLAMEMKKPENEAHATPPVASEATKAKWKKELQRTSMRCRYEAETLKRSMEAYEQEQVQRLGRLRLVPCADKVIARFKEQSKATGYNPINEFHLAWLEIQRKANSLHRFDEKAWLQYQRNTLRYNTLLKEAEEAEKLEGEM